MVDAIRLFVGAILRLIRTRRRLLLENLALRQQLAALKRRHPRPRLAMFDRVFWVLARKFWSGWKQALMIVSPETVVRWHRSGFAMYWRAISRGRRIVGRRRTSKEVRDLIFRMVADRPYLRRDGNRKGASGARAPQSEPTSLQGFREGELCCYSGWLARKRTLWPRKRGIHRRDRPTN